MNGKRILGLGVVLAVVTAAVIWQVTALEGQAQSTGGFAGAILDVQLDLTELTSAGAPAPIPISLTGKVFLLDGPEVGVVRVWGVKTTEGSTTVSTINANFELPVLNGTFTAQGTLTRAVVDFISGDDLVAITGGTGTFRGANGEATIRDIGGGTLRVRLLEVKRR